LFPVSNLVVPVGVLLAERALYLPSAGLVLAAGAWLKDLETRRRAVVLSLLVVAGGVRTALRVPVWRDTRAMIGSELEDSPGAFSYRYESSVARARGYPVAADSFAARVGRAPDPVHAR